MNINQLKHVSYSNMQENHKYGYISDHEWRVYQFFWTWSYPRFGGTAGLIHDRLFARVGVDRYYRRINKVRRMLGMNDYQVPEIYR